MSYKKTSIKKGENLNLKKNGQKNVFSPEKSSTKVERFSKENEWDPLGTKTRQKSTYML